MIKKLSAVGNSPWLIIERPILELLSITRDTAFEVKSDGERESTKRMMTTHHGGRQRGYVESSMRLIRELFEKAEIPEKRIVLVHARLRRLKVLLQSDYSHVTRAIVDALWALKPRTILVPAYTFSYMKTGVHSSEFSRSEVGRFSEEVRTTLKHTRTPDPMYSLMDLGDCLHQQEGLHHRSTYEPGSVFHFLTEQDYVILNLDLEGLYATQFHYVERLHEVDYRFTKNYDGFLHGRSGAWHPVSYRTCARHLDAAGVPKPNYERIKIRQWLHERGVYRQSRHDGIELGWMSSQDFTHQLGLELGKNRRFLVESP